MEGKEKRLEGKERRKTDRDERWKEGRNEVLGRIGKEDRKKGSDDDGWWKDLDYYSNFYFFYFLFLIINRYLWLFSCPSVAKLLRSRIWPQMGSDRKSWSSWRKLAQSSTSLQSNSTLKGPIKVQTQDCLLWGSSDNCCATKMANLIKFKQKEEKSGLDLGEDGYQ